MYPYSNTNDRKNLMTTPVIIDTEIAELMQSIDADSHAIYRLTQSIEYNKKYSWLGKETEEKEIKRDALTQKVIDNKELKKINQELVLLSYQLTISFSALDL